MPTLQDISDLKRVLSNLNAEKPAAQRPTAGQTLYAQRDDDFLKRLELEIESEPSRARILVTGQIGVGKSSELWRLFDGFRANSSRPFPIFCNLEKQEHPERCGATGVLLTALRDSWAALKEYRKQRLNAQAAAALFRIRDKLIEQLVDWLKGTMSEGNDDVAFQFGGMRFGVSLAKDIRNSALALILGKAAQHEAVSDPGERFGVAPDSLVSSLNRILEWTAKNLRTPLLIIDHVDKIRDAAAAEDVLLSAFTHWQRICASIVMTAPYEVTLGDLRNSVESKWGTPRMVYPVPFPDLDDTSLPRIYLEIVERAGLQLLISPDAVRLLAHFSGGILRYFVQFVIEASKEAYFTSQARIERAEAMAVVRRAQQAYQDYTVSDLALLNGIAESGTGLREAARVLRSPIGLIVCGDGASQQLRVHPLAQNALEKYRNGLLVAG